MAKLYNNGKFIVSDGHGQENDSGSQRWIFTQFCWKPIGVGKATRVSLTVSRFVSNSNNIFLCALTISKDHHKRTMFPAPSPLGKPKLKQAISQGTRALWAVNFGWIFTQMLKLWGILSFQKSCSRHRTHYWSAFELLVWSGKDESEIWLYKSSRFHSGRSFLL